ncbi:MAG: hypothetical protein OJF48_003229 [Afipia sp.]|nr:MAG: hypothetical protein OJF48_003229 [Afipia sp.]
MSTERHLAPLRDVEDENDQLRQLLIQAGVEAHAHVVAAKLQTVWPRRCRAAASRSDGRSMPRRNASPSNGRKAAGRR